MRRPKRVFYLEDRYGFVVKVIKAPDARCAALKAARRGFHDIWIRDPSDVSGQCVSVTAFLARGRYRFGLYAGKPYGMVRKKGQDYRNRVLQSFQDVTLGVEVVQ